MPAVMSSRHAALKATSRKTFVEKKLSARKDDDVVLVFRCRVFTQTKKCVVYVATN